MESVVQMNFGIARNRALQILTMVWAALALALIPQFAAAQEAAPAPEALVAPAPITAPADAATEAAVSEGSTVDPAAGSDAYTPMAPTAGKGMPIKGGMTFQDQYSKDGEFAVWMHDAILIPVIFAISLFVLGLILWVVAKYNRRANPKPSRTTHNTFIEVVWTLVPVLILVVIAIPSITLLARQYESPPEDAVTIKATGYQWYWGYSYPDNGDFEVISNMLSKGDAIANGEPDQLAVDNRMVVPANTPLRIQTTGADVIHAFSVPSLWFKMDAVPGRLNERMMVIEEPGVYYGQCSELCGARHGYMPIAVEALPRPQWEAWVRAQGGTVGGDKKAPLEAAPLQRPESAIPGAPGDGPPPTGPATSAPAPAV